MALGLAFRWPSSNALVLPIEIVIDLWRVRGIPKDTATVREVVLALGQRDRGNVLGVANDKDGFHACETLVSKQATDFSLKSANSPMIMCARTWQCTIHTPGCSMRIRHTRHPAGAPGSTLPSP
jgi:hypothetical protein